MRSRIALSLLAAGVGALLGHVTALALHLSALAQEGTE